jgi:hypothetical protein
MFFRNIVHCDKNDIKLSDKIKTEEDGKFKLKGMFFLLRTKIIYFYLQVTSMQSCMYVCTVCIHSLTVSQLTAYILYAVCLCTYYVVCMIS